MKPKCFSEVGLPPQIIASKLIRAFRNNAGEDKVTPDFLGRQSLCLCIAVFFLYKSGNCTAPCFHKTLVTINNCPVVKLCGARPMQLLCSFVSKCFVPASPYIYEIALMQFWEEYHIQPFPANR